MPAATELYVAQFTLWASNVTHVSDAPFYRAEVSQNVYTHPYGSGRRVFRIIHQRCCTNSGCHMQWNIIRKPFSLTLCSLLERYISYCVDGERGKYQFSKWIFWVSPARLMITGIVNIYDMKHYRRSRTQPKSIMSYN